MVQPPLAKEFAQPLGPKDVQEYVVTLTRGDDDDDLLSSAEQVTEFNCFLPDDAIDAGLVLGVGDYAPAQIDDLNFRFWFSIAALEQDSALWTGRGQRFNILFRFVTDSTPQRELERTIVLPVQRQ